MQGSAAPGCCTGAGEGLWSQLGDPASILLLSSMRTHIRLRRNPAAKEGNPRNLWLVYSENSEQTWNLENIYTWTQLSVFDKERSLQAAGSAQPSSSLHGCTWNGFTEASVPFFFRIRRYRPCQTMSVSILRPERRQRRRHWVLSSLCVIQ